MSHLWLSLATILLSGSDKDQAAAFWGSISLFFVVLFMVMFSIQVNDLCDQREDEAAGKKRWIFVLPYSAGIFILAALGAAGFAVIFLAGGSTPVMLAYTASILLGLFYSLPPVRFKERGIWGVIGYASAVTTIYVIVPWTWFHSSVLVLGLLLSTVFLDKWVQLHFHQVIDYEADLKNLTPTYAVRVGLKRARETLRVASLSASLSIGCLLAYLILFLTPALLPRIVLIGLLMAVLAATRFYVQTAKKNSGRGSDLVKELSWIYLGLTYFLFGVFPPVGFLFLAFKEPLMGILAAFSGLSLLSTSWHSILYKYK